MKIDYDLLRSQRFHLINLISGEGEVDIEVLEGILNLLDSIQDEDIDIACGWAD